jgi:AcrR family transcriptional regulator
VETASEIARPLRADAQRNLSRILESARCAFAEAGVDVGVAEIARRAGVGNATIFRRFPAKEDLIIAVVESALREHIAAAREAVDAEHPGAALREFAHAMVAWQLDDRFLMDSICSSVMIEPRLQELKAELSALLGRLLENAQRSGDVRDDVEPQDIAVLCNGVARIGDTFEQTAPGAWRRYLAIVLDGLRPGGTPIDVASPSWDAMCAASGLPTVHRS